MTHPLPTRRTGATRTADIPADVLTALSRGEIASHTLTEGLALDQRVLVRQVFPALPGSVLDAVDAASALGILKRMSTISGLLLEALGPAAVASCAAHASDTVRGWACFMIGQQVLPSLATRLEAIRPLADDPHFGVREWVWLGTRPALVQDLDAAIDALVPWTASPQPYVRRYASESLRPRGVWCAHIPALKADPARALPLLMPLRADPSPYVQDSVANWLNDAGKHQPDWVRAVCHDWLAASNTAATQRICQRALRNLKP